MSAQQDMASRSDSPELVEEPTMQDSPVSTINNEPEQRDDNGQPAQQRQEGGSQSRAETQPIFCDEPEEENDEDATHRPRPDRKATAGGEDMARQQSQSSSTSSRRCCSRNHSHVGSHTQSRSSSYVYPGQRSSSNQASGSASGSNTNSDGAHTSGRQANGSRQVSSGSKSQSRTTSRNTSHDFRETLDARSKDMEDGSRVINQYRMTDVIGQGSYGTVHRATLADDPSVTFAIKEFGKTRLRKSHRASNLKRSSRDRPVGRGGAARPRGGFVAAHDSFSQERKERQGGGDAGKEGSDQGKGQGKGGDDEGGGRGKAPKTPADNDDLKDPLVLIRHEMAILKKLHHPHVVKLYEVLDDPSKDSLYMVFEHCPDGAVIDIRLHHQTEPLDEETARSYFVQIMLGIEYLHSNDIVHRDLKPDNILLSDNGKTCKIVDFGVSEMFLKPGDDKMQKSAGSPAFMSPELCTAGHSWYHGRSDDIWSFGVTIYCMVVGHLPFDKDNFFEMYEAIKNEEPEYPSHLSPELKDLLQKLLTKDPEKRITIEQMREHPWVTCNGTATIIPAEENLEQVVFEITEEELDCAICKITNIFTFARAISKFKKGGSMNRARREASLALSEAESKAGSESASGAAESKGEERRGQPVKERDMAREGARADGSADGGEGAGRKPTDEDRLDASVDALKDELERPPQEQDVLLVDSPTSDTIELPDLDDEGDAEGQDHLQQAKREALRRTRTDPAGESPDKVLSKSPELFDSPSSASPPRDQAHNKSDDDMSQSHSEDLARRLAEVVMREGGGNNAWKSKDPPDGKKKRVSILMSAKTGEVETSRDHLSREYKSPSSGDSASSDGSGKGDDVRPARKPTTHRTPPKVLEEDTVESPKSEQIPTPPGASRAYVAAARDDDLADDPMELEAVRAKEKEGGGQGQQQGQQRQDYFEGGGKEDQGKDEKPPPRRNSVEVHGGQQHE